MKFLVVLDTMWGGAGNAAPRWFTINPLNVSGKRLYKLTGAKFGELLVTNACPERVPRAEMHGKPNAQWLYDSLLRIPRDWENAPLLVCGRTANDTYSRMRKLYGSGSRQRGLVVRLKHPAARTWTKAEIESTARKLQNIYPI